MDFGTAVFLLLLQLGTFCYAGPGWDPAVDNGNSGESDKSSITETILKMNNGSTAPLMEGDLMIQRTRTAIKCAVNAQSCLWPKSGNGQVLIPYIIANRYSISERDIIEGALRGIEAGTCIRFIRRGTQKAYLNFEPSFGCFSRLGRKGGRQLVSLQRFGCVQRGIVQHEVLHALGFYHEHTRSDRDEHILIHWENIQDFNKPNFEKQDTDNLDTPYDYNSIMHYGRTAFGVQEAVTMTPIPDGSVDIGQREGLSELDVLRINRLYNCWN